MERFEDRREAGRLLGERLAESAIADPIVLGLPRGGVPVADEVARVLDAPLDVLVVRKLGLPWHPEVAMGAVGEDDAIVVNDDVVAFEAVPAQELQRVADRERAEVSARVTRFREGRPGVRLAGRTAVVVDDGIATGATARAACRVARARGAERVVLAAPVAPPELLRAFPEADETVCLLAPPRFMAVGMHYVDFAQVDDAEVIAILRAARR